jgi:hypothetical protein
MRMPSRRAKTGAAPRPSSGKATGKGGGPPGENGRRYCQRAGWDVIDVADGIAVHDAAFKTVHYLNHSAAVVFLLCKEPMSLAVIAAIFREEFELDKEPLTELRRILAAMKTTGLIEVVKKDAAEALAPKPRRVRTP